METAFARVIEEHLELKRRNSTLDGDMPLRKYQVHDPFENHPLFKTEEQARLEDTLSGEEAQLLEPTALNWPVEEPEEVRNEVPDPEDTFWGRSRDFDWGD
jgi:hypothetical protein